MLKPFVYRNKAGMTVLVKDGEHEVIGPAQIGIQPAHKDAVSAPFVEGQINLGTDAEINKDAPKWNIPGGMPARPPFADQHKVNHAKNE